ncbi:MAG: universal stress protein [Actinomycetota bacterium]
MGRCTLAAVLDRDVLSARVEREERQRMLDALEAASALLPDRQPDTVLLEGKPSDALARYAAEGGYELLVVGRRGDGASKALLGSTAATLARGGEVPILIV